MKESSPPGGRILFFWTEETAKIEEKMENFHGKRENNYVSHYFLYASWIFWLKKKKKKNRISIAIFPKKKKKKKKA